MYSPILPPVIIAVKNNDFYDKNQMKNERRKSITENEKIWKGDAFFAAACRETRHLHLKKLNFVHSILQNSDSIRNLEYQIVRALSRHEQHSWWRCINIDFDGFLLKFLTLLQTKQLTTNPEFYKFEVISSIQIKSISKMKLALKYMHSKNYLRSSHN